MKALFVALLFLIGGPVAAQQPYQFSPLPLDAHTHTVVYAATVPVEGVAQAQLYARAREWAAQLRGPAQGSALRATPETGRVSTQVRLKNGQESYGCRVTITAQEGAYRYVLTNVTYTQPSYARAGKYSAPGPVTSKIETLVYTRPGRLRDKKLTEIDLALRRLLQDLTQRMLNQTDGLARQ
ncbi:hypothetical protein E5K00_15380 [Hymenobacter aquaticus]|uniref:DUF4468 domain-containing protein n=1 Tax=Hymenobacter aquaticus TaxID=1867101 RepID=A0A4Z0PVY8_9BACT|nr:hypothetical protein [Hymenobacter aquaticus]TGE21655.1 hypothetical protein E5K00_15380 [Hymenobacter aquaticus]